MMMKISLKTLQVPEDDASCLKVLVSSEQTGLTTGRMLILSYECHYMSILHRKDHIYTVLFFQLPIIYLQNLDMFYLKIEKKIAQTAWKL